MWTVPFVPFWKNKQFPERNLRADEAALSFERIERLLHAF
jgi:hypothetical protein